MIISTAISQHHMQVLHFAENVWGASRPWPQRSVRFECGRYAEEQRWLAVVPAAAFRACGTPLIADRPARRWP